MQMTGKCWRDGFGADETIQRVRPVESFAYLPNPHRGTTTYQRFNGDPCEPVDGGWNDGGPFDRPPFGGSTRNVGYPDTTVAYLRWEWSKFEPRRGERHWDWLDEHLRIAGERGQTVQFRLNPYSETPPAWYWDAGGRPAAGNGKEPDCNAPLWFECFGDTIREFGSRYDGHPLLETVDTSYGGLWGENGGNAGRDTRERFLALYMESFKSTPLMVLEGDVDLVFAATHGLGWRADCFGDMRTDGRGVVPEGLCWNHMHDRYPFMLWATGSQECWRTAPVTMETCWHVGWWFRNGWDIDWILEQGAKYHMTYFMPKSCAIPEECAEKIAEFDNRIGYRFVIRQMELPLEIAPGAPLDVRVWLDNVGVAPLYRPYRFAYRLRQGAKAEILHSAQDVRRWMPEYTCFRDRLTVPEWMAPGDVSLDVGLVDARDDARIRFAIETPADEGWHVMAQMEVRG